MSLNPYSIDRCPGLPHTLEQIEKADATSFVRRPIKLEAVFVDDQTRAGVSFSRRAMGEIEIIWAHLVDEYSGAKAIGPAVLGFDRLIHNVPAMYLSAVTTRQAVDVVNYCTFHRLLAG
jgi:hypothetical protein